MMLESAKLTPIPYKQKKPPAVRKKNGWMLVFPAQKMGIGRYV